MGGGGLVSSGLAEGRDETRDEQGDFGTRFLMPSLWSVVAQIRFECAAASAAGIKIKSSSKFQAFCALTYVVERGTLHAQIVGQSNNNGLRHFQLFGRFDSNLFGHT